MNPRARHVARRLVLEILESAGHFLVPVEPTLLAHVNLVTRPPLTLSELDALLAEMESQKLIVQQNCDGIVKTKITQEGRAARMEQ